MSIAASLVVQFGQGADSSALVKMEWDKTLNVDAAGEEKSQFSPGDQAFFLIHYDSSKLRIGKVLATHGQVVKQSLVSPDRDQQLLFAEDDDTHELEYIPSGPLSAEWYVASGNEPTIRCTGRTAGITGGRLPALVKVGFKISAQGYRLQTPNVSLAEGESYPITVVAWMEAA